MTGPIEWSVLIFIIGAIMTTVGLAGTCAWFLAGIAKDVRHTKASVKQHAQIFAEMHNDMALWQARIIELLAKTEKDVIRLQDEVARLGKLVNGR